MINYPLLYLFLYYKIRSRMKNEQVICSKRDFRIMLSKPLGIDKRMSEFILRDFQRYKMISYITHGKKGRIEFIPINNNAKLFTDLVEIKRVGLI